MPEFMGRNRIRTDWRFFAGSGDVGAFILWDWQHPVSRISTRPVSSMPFQSLMNPGSFFREVLESHEFRSTHIRHPKIKRSYARKLMVWMPPPEGITMCQVSSKDAMEA
jgi:hypothetical protein